MVAQVQFPPQVPLHQRFHRRGIEQVSVRIRAFAQRFHHQLAQWPAQPLVRRNIEPVLFPVQQRRRQLVPPQFG